MPMREILGELLKDVPFMDAANYNVIRMTDHQKERCDTHCQRLLFGSAQVSSEREQTS